MKRLAIVLVLGACSSTPETPPDANPAEIICQVPPSFDLAVASEQHAEAQGEYLGLVGALADTDGDMLTDAISIELYQGSGAFADTPIAPGTYTVEDQYATCGACVLIYGDYGDGTIGQTMLATSGTLSLTAVDDRLSGTLIGAELHLVNLDEDHTSTVVMDGCVTTISQLSFDAEIMR